MERGQREGCIAFDKIGVDSLERGRRDSIALCYKSSLSTGPSFDCREMVKSAYLDYYW